MHATVATKSDLAAHCVQLERRLELAMHWGAALLQHHIDETTSLIAKLQQLRGTEPGIAYTLGRRDGLAVGAHQQELVRDVLRAASAWVERGTVFPAFGEPLTDAVLRWESVGKPGLEEP